MARSRRSIERGARGMARRWPRSRRSLPSYARTHRPGRLVTMNSPVTVIDRSRGIMPRAFDRAGVGEADPAARQRLQQLQAKAIGRDANGIVELALKEAFAGRTGVISSFGSESVVLLHLVAQVDPSAPVLF